MNKVLLKQLNVYWFTEVLRYYRYKKEKQWIGPIYKLCFM